ncbi:MAG: glutamate--cysteine ligase [Candidatus Mycalebacterium zealandia]|nr:MAG: glutamate--cysteine ligase [Candidatus Mycalebacterium zealandia]
MDFINEASETVAGAAADIKAWEAAHLEKVFVPFYSSADIRISSNKAAVVDTNIFPAGFNNLSPEFRDRLGLLIRDAISRKYPGTGKLLVIPEIHARNPHYWENVKTLEEVLRARGFEVKVGFVDDEIKRGAVSVAASGGGTVEVVKAARDGAKISAAGFVPDVVLLNNDFSNDCPTILRDIEQPVLPPVEIGWHSRRKDVHFEFYNSLAREAAAVCKIDPAIISIETRLIEDVDFDESEDRERVALVADEMAGTVPAGPLLFVKSNNGTYGMSVVAVSGGDAIRNMNAENRKKMRAGKSKKPSGQIVIQEGVETVLRTDEGMPAEPVLYMVETEVAGAFYRTNSKKSAAENLNSSGMEFRQFPDCVKDLRNIPELLSLCAKIAALAAGYEIEKVMLEGGCE